MNLEEIKEGYMDERVWREEKERRKMIYPRKVKKKNRKNVTILSK